MYRWDRIIATQSNDVEWSSPPSNAGKDGNPPVPINFRLTVGCYVCDFDKQRPNELSSSHQVFRVSEISTTNLTGKVV